MPHNAPALQTNMDVDYVISYRFTDTSMWLYVGFKLFLSYM